MVEVRNKIINGPPLKKPSYDKILNKPCVIHSTAENSAAHTTRQCRVLKKIQLEKALAPGDDGEGDVEANESALAYPR